MCTGLNLKSDGCRVIVFTLSPLGKKKINASIQVLFLSGMGGRGRGAEGEGHFCRGVTGLNCHIWSPPSQSWSPCAATTRLYVCHLLRASTLAVSRCLAHLSHTSLGSAHPSGVNLNVTSSKKLSLTNWLQKLLHCFLSHRLLAFS